MKITIRLFTTSLLVALNMFFYSCKDSVEDTPPLFAESNQLQNAFEKYGIDPSDYEYFSYRKIADILITSGLKDETLWTAAFDTISYRQLCEYVDTEITPKKVIKNLGYGEYKPLALQNIMIEGLIVTDNGYIGQIGIIYTDGGQLSYHEAQMKLITFFSRGNKIEASIDYDCYDISLDIKCGVRGWYEDSAIVSDTICFNDKGDTLFMVKSPILETEVPVSYTDGVNIDIVSQRINHATGEIIWRLEIVPPFEIPSNAKKKITILEQDNDIWKCKADILFYDGTKKEFTFKINIKDGIIVNPS